MTDVSDIERLVDSYRMWLRDRTTLRNVHADWVEITTPYLDRHNDYIQIYVRKENGAYRLTDDGHTIRDLELSGCLLDIPKRKSLLKIAINGFAVDLNDGVLSVCANSDNFSARKHALVQAILAVNDLFYTSRPIVKSLFKEDVEHWLDLSDIRFLPNVQFTGKSGYTHQFDFGIPRSKTAPERILKAINNPNKDTAQSLIFAWLDTREERPTDSLAVAILNDAERPVTGAVTGALERYDIRPLLWSDREKNRMELAA
ncbi:DUF1829 domain-containing protein [Methylosinus sp. Ce-a6]|uniref:DUF1829 domain-containing protein n=1 Tax=Methylosinus sp. Ce-a6 TaxID=2172005 RepID=UPI001916BA0A|nr:DUF1829 domain-containing protein [Methylosinus sp. Ce-a6]